MSDVFISYSRKDTEVVRRLHDELARLKRDTWVDWEDIPPAAEWLAEVCNAIEQADTFVFVISPESVASKVCREELAHAVTHNKRLVPLVRREALETDLPEALSKLNWIYFREIDDFEKAFRSLIDAIDTDLEWVRAHTRLDVRASEWERKGRDSSLLLRGGDLQNAEQWLKDAGRHQERNPTALQTEFILAGRKTTITRQRIVLSSVSVGLFVAITLALIAFVEYRISEKRRKISVSQKLAAQALNHLDDRLDLALLLSIEACKIDESAEARSALLTAVQRRPGVDAFLSGHRDAGISIAFSPDGKVLASGSWDGRIILWDTSRRQPRGLPLFDSKFGNVNRVVFSPDGKTLASAGDDKIVLWDAINCRPLTEPLKYPTMTPITDIGFSPDGKTFASGDSATGQHRPSIVLWDLASRKPLGTPIVGSKFAFSPDGRTLAFGSDDDNDILLKDATTREAVFTRFAGHKRQLQCLAFSPDGKILASGDEGGIVILWDVATAEPLFAPLTNHLGVVNSVAFRPDGNVLASGSGDKTIIFWNVKTGKPIGEPLVGTGDFVYSVAFSPSGEALASCGGQDRRVALWDLAGNHALVLAVGRAEVGDADVVFSPDGSSVATADGESAIFLDGTSGVALGEPFRGHKDRIECLALSPDGQTLASGCMNGSVILWDVSSRRPRGPALAVDAHPVFSLAFSPDSRIMASGSDSDLMFWDLPTRQAIRGPLTNHLDRLWSLAFSPDGKLLASCGGSDGGVVLWSVLTGQALGPPLVAPASADKNQTLSKVSVAFSPDGKQLASTSPADNSVIFWDVATRRPIGAPLVGHRYPVYSLAFSPDGQLLATGSADDTVILWDVATRQPLGKPFGGHTNEVYSVAFSPKGGRLASGGSDNRIVLWDISSESWRSRACSIANRNLTKDEWRRYLGDEPYRKTCPNLPGPDG